MVKFTPFFFLALGAPLLVVRGDAYGSLASASSSLPSSGSSDYNPASDSESKSVYGSTSDSFSGSAYGSSSGSSSVPAYGSASESAPSGSSSVPGYGSSSKPTSESTSGPSSGSEEAPYETSSGSSSVNSANCTLDTTVPTQCDGSDNWWPVSVVGEGTFCTQGPVCVGTEGANCPVPQSGLDFGSQCIVLSKESGVRGCIPKPYCGEVLPAPESFYSQSGSQETTPDVQTTAPGVTPYATPSAKCDVDLEASVTAAPTNPSGDIPDQTPAPIETVPTAYDDTEATETPAYSEATPSPQSNLFYDTPSTSYDADGSDFDGDYSGSDYDDDYDSGSVDYDGSDVSASYSSENDIYPVEDTSAPSTDPVSAYSNIRSLRHSN